MEKEKFKLIYIGYYDKENYKFMLNSTSKISFEELYNGPNQKFIDTKNNELINEQNIPEIKYLYNNPHKIHFIFPDDKTYEIYIANMRQLLHNNHENNKENKYQAIISDDGINYYRNYELIKIYASKYIKYIISAINEEEYNYSLSYIENNGPLCLKDLSLNYDYYLEYTHLIKDNKNFFVNTEQRKEFFEFLDNKLL